MHRWRYRLGRRGELGYRTMNRAFALLVFLAALCCIGARDGTQVTWGTAPATITTITAIGQGGGLAQVGGTNFVGTVSDPPSAWVFLSGFPGPATPFTVTYNSSTSLYLTLASGSYSTGFYTIEIQGTDGQKIKDTSNFQITPDLTPATIFGSNLKAQYICNLATCSGSCTTGSGIVTIPDQSGNSNTLNLVSTTAPTIQQNDTRFSQPNVTTCVMTAGSSTSLGISALNVGGSPAAIYTFGAVDVTAATGTLQGLWNYFTTSGLNIGVTNISSVLEFTSTYLTTGSLTGIAPLLNPAILETGYNGTTAVSAVNNAVISSHAYANAVTNSQSFYVGQYNGTDFSSFVWPEIDIVNVVPTTTQALQMNQYYNATYGVTAFPGYLYNTGMLASTASTPIRIQNSAGLTNYYTSTAVALVNGSTSYACTNAGLVGTTSINSMDQTCVSTPPGTYDLAITNPDGRLKSYSGVVNVTSGTTAWTNFGTSVTEWYSAANVTCSASPCVSGSSGITSYFDQAALGNTPTQGVFADEPIWQSGVGDST